MTSLQSLTQEFAITIASAEVWLSIGLALLLGGLCLVVGICVDPGVGLLDRNAPAGETLGVGLGLGLMVLAAWWAAIWSGGRSSFTPVAVGFAIAIGLALARRVRRPDVLTPSLRSSSPVTATRRAPGGASKRKAHFSRSLPAASSSSRSRCCTARPWRQARGTASSPSSSMTWPSTRSSAATWRRPAPRRIRLPSGFSDIPGVPGPDLVPLGRAVAGVCGHHDLRNRPDRRPPLHRAARRLARNSGADRYDRATRDRHDVDGRPSFSDFSRACSWRPCN